jgi:hypothetical protein
MHGGLPFDPIHLFSQEKRWMLARHTHPHIGLMFLCMPVWPCDRPTLEAQSMHNNTQSMYGKYQDAVCGHPAQPETSSRGKWAVKQKKKKA